MAGWLLNLEPTGGGGSTPDTFPGTELCLNGVMWPARFFDEDPVDPPPEVGTPTCGWDFESQETVFTFDAEKTVWLFDNSETVWDFGGCL